MADRSVGVLTACDVLVIDTVTAPHSGLRLCALRWLWLWLVVAVVRARGAARGFSGGLERGVPAGTL